MKPRRHFGPNPPGRLQQTMVKVLAAEMSDPKRFSRGKRYYAQDAVTDITIGRGIATAEVQGSRVEPYVVTMETEPGDGIPKRQQTWVDCTCPDDSGTGRNACKHAVAGMLALANEFAIEPELVERWRTPRHRVTQNMGRASTIDDQQAAQLSYDDPDRDVLGNGTVIPFPNRGVRANGGDDNTRAGGYDDPGRAVNSRPKQHDQMGPLLAAPSGSSLPEFGTVEPLEHPGRFNDLFYDTLDDALRNLKIRWE